VTPGQAPLNLLLALGEPVQSRIELVLIGAGHVELLGQRRAPQPPGTGQLGARLKQPLRDHRQHQPTLARRRAIHQPRQLEAPKRAQHRGDMPMRQRALDRKRLLGRDQRLAGQRAAQRVHRRRRQLRDVGDRLVMHPLALADGAADQVRLIDAVAVPPPDRGYVHRTH
jgi:hypothetical protein